MKMLNNILDWLMPKSFRSYWSHWFMLAYFGIGCAMHCPAVLKAILWPLAMILPFLRDM